MRPALTPAAAFKLAEALHESGGMIDPRMEAIIAQAPREAFLYARDILGRAWPEAEPAIAQDLKASYWYAMLFRWSDVDLDRFIQAGWKAAQIVDMIRRNR